MGAATQNTEISAFFQIRLPIKAAFYLCAAEGGFVSIGHRRES
jgi:hypothetical protein